MPKALSSETMIAARKVPGTLPRPPITTTTSASVITCRSIVWLAASRGSSSAPPRPARKTPSAKTLVNSHFWLTPSAATISRSCVAARTSTPQVVRRKSSHRNARTSGARAISSRSYVGKGWPKRSIAPLKPGRARTEQIARPPDQQHEILDDERDAEGREQLKQFRRVVDAAQQQHFDERADRGDDERGERDRAPEADDAAQPVGQRVPDIGAQHVEGAMREIDDAGDAENDREAGGDEKQRAGAREPRNELDKIEAQGRAPPLERPTGRRSPRPRAASRRAISSAGAEP